MIEFQQADLTNPAERIMLADHFEEIGQDDEASILRRDDAADLGREPHHATDVVQMTGPDDRREERRVTVATSYGDHADGRDWATLLPSERRWWIETLRELHAAEVRLASADAEIREQFEEMIQTENLDDLEFIPAIYNRILDELEAV